MRPLRHAMNLPSPPDANAHVPSPCIGVCRMDPADRWCVGCLRSRDEIGQWGQMTSREKLALWADITQHRAALATVPMAAEPDA